MNAVAPTNPAKNAAPPREKPPGAVPPLAARLRHVIRILIDIGEQRLIAIKSQRLTAGQVQDTGHGFGTFNLSVIAARIMRGLRLARALDQRVIQTEARIDGPKPTPKPRAPRPPRPPRKPKLSEADDNAALLARLPTDREIAIMARRRPIGIVLGDICADLGIGPGHPQWQDLWHNLRGVIAACRGSLTPPFKRAFDRVAAAYREVVAGLAPNWTFYNDPEPKSGTGPPMTSAT